MGHRRAETTRATSPSFQRSNVPSRATVSSAFRARWAVQETLPGRGGRRTSRSNRGASMGRGMPAPRILSDPSATSTAKSVSGGPFRTGLSVSYRSIEPSGRRSTSRVAPRSRNVPSRGRSKRIRPRLRSHSARGAETTGSPRASIRANPSRTVGPNQEKWNRATSSLLGASAALARESSHRRAGAVPRSVGRAATSKPRARTAPTSSLRHNLRRPRGLGASSAIIRVGSWPKRKRGPAEADRGVRAADLTPSEQLRDRTHPSSRGGPGFAPGRSALSGSGTSTGRGWPGSA